MGVEAKMIAQFAKTAGAVVMIAAFLVGAALIGTAHAADLSQPVVLVASQNLDGSLFQQTVVIAAPLPDGGHIGFIVNRPTTVKLSTLFPEQTPARNVKEPVYLGGPALASSVFVLMRRAPDGASVIPLMPGVVAVFDKETVDRVIETTPNAGRYFVGMMLWDADELEQEVAGRVWDVRHADVNNVLPAQAPGLWRSLRQPMASIREATEA
jgi:putative transcriptional regulator